jgi:hypothetical protein
MHYMLPTSEELNLLTVTTGELVRRALEWKPSTGERPLVSNPNLAFRNGLTIAADPRIGGGER